MARAAGASTRNWIARSFVTHLLAGTLPGRIIDLLDRVLLVLMFVPAER